MTIAIGTKNKLQFLEGRITQPPLDSLLAPLRNHNNKLLLVWILTSVATTIVCSYMGYNSTYDVWFALRERFSRGSNFKIIELHEQIFALEQGSMIVSKFLWS
ncbi:hypothetical protein LINPERPRIM_LOCUS5294 [Linum perenne]